VPVEEAEEAEEAEEESSSNGSSVKLSVSFSSASSNGIGGGGKLSGSPESLALANCLCKSLMLYGDHAISMRKLIGLSMVANTHEVAR